MSHMTEHVGRVVGGRYRLLAPLGSGASAEVYLADDVRLRRRVAVKILHTALSDDDAFLRRFRAEARAAAALNHPNIVAIFDWNGDVLPPYLVTEYLGGGSLRALLDKGERLTPSQTLVIGHQAAQALDHAHRQGFVHRDIKPANLLFGDEVRLRIADFGLARAIAEAGWTEPSGAVLGTARYASPEQVRGEPLTGRSDVYSLALLMIEAVTGVVPFSADTTIGTLMARLDTPIEVPDELDALAPVLRRAGHPDVGQRPDAATLVNDLMDAATELPRPEPLSLAGATAATRQGDAPQDRTLLGATAMGRVLPPPPGAHQAGSPGAEVTAVQPLAQRPPPPLPPGSGQLHPIPRFRPPALGSTLVRVLAVLAILALGVAGTWVFTQVSVTSHRVPQELIGAQKGDVLGIVDDFGWTVKQEEVYQDGTQAGVVLATNPEPGQKLREGSTLRVTVSLGPTLVTVPSNDQLAGLTQDEADTLIREAQLVPEFVPTASDDVDEDLVIGLAEGVPAQLGKGLAVQVLVSTGPEGVPDVEGWDFQDAKDELERRGFEVEVRGDRSREVSQGKVIKTQPGKGDDIESGDKVTIVVSTGNGPLEVPDVEDLTVAEATTELQNVGLQVGSVYGSQDGSVASTTPFIGSRVDPGDKVDLWMW